MKLTRRERIISNFIESKNVNLNRKKIDTINYLIIGGTLNILIALLHLAIVFGGAKWYRFFGAGEAMARLAEGGSIYPTVVTTIIAVVLTLWGLYGFSGAGIVIRLPLLKPILFIVSIIYILRGILGIPIVFLVDHPYLNELGERISFMIISSVISLILGLLYLIGTIKRSHLKIN